MQLNPMDYYNSAKKVKVVWAPASATKKTHQHNKSIKK